MSPTARKWRKPPINDTWIEICVLRELKFTQHDADRRKASPILSSLDTDQIMIPAAIPSLVAIEWYALLYLMQLLLQSAEPELKIKLWKDGRMEGWRDG